jgi:4-hydroxy-tetrahydrodipicolinate synthase
MQGLIANLPTPFDASRGVDIVTLTKLAQSLLEAGCDGLCVMGCLGEAMSLSLEERAWVMSGVAATIPIDKVLVGTGAFALPDAIEVTNYAAGMGFAGVLVLPPLAYNGNPEAGLMEYIRLLIEETSDKPIPLYLYNTSVFEGLIWTPQIILELHKQFPERLVGLKDSSHDSASLRLLSEQAPDLKIYPNSPSALLGVRSGMFAGIISAIVTIAPELCQQVIKQGASLALDKLLAMRNELKNHERIAAVKALLAHQTEREDWHRLRPPLMPLESNIMAEFIARMTDLPQATDI